MLYYQGLFAFCTLACSFYPTQEEDLAAVKALSAQYEENRIKFYQGRLTFEFTDALAKDFDDTLHDRVTDSYTARGFYAFKKDMAIYKCDYSAEAILASTKHFDKTTTSTRLNPIHMATNGKKTILDRILATPKGEIGHGVMLKGGSEEFYNKAQVPFDLGFPVKYRVDLTSIAKAIDDHLPGISVVSIENEVTVDGVKTIKMTIKFATGSKTLWIDPERSSVPLRVWDKYNSGTEAFYSFQDIRHIDGRGWIPFRQVMFSGGFVKKIVVSNADFTDIPDTVFRLDFDEPRPILDEAAQLTYPAQKSWDLNRLPSPSSLGTLQAARPGSEPPMPTEIPQRVPIFTYGAIGVCLLVVSFFVIKRYLRS